MAKYRQIHVSFWQDTFVLDLTPEEKYFYLYLMTNSKTSACGIYELPKKVMEMETGYNRESIEKLLQRFIEYGKARYSDKTKEVYLPNWIKFNEPKSELTAKCVVSELNNVKNREFADAYLHDADILGYPLEGASKGLSSPYQVKEKEKEKDKETETEKEKETSCAEPLRDSTPVFIHLPLNDGSLYAITTTQVGFWQKLYPAVHVEQELRAMLGWLDANGNKRKTKSGVAKFVNGWLAKQQNEGGATRETTQRIDNSAPARVQRANERRERERREQEAATEFVERAD